MGCFHGDGQRVLTPLVSSVLIGSSLQEQTHLTTRTRKKTFSWMGQSVATPGGGGASSPALPSVTGSGRNVQRSPTSQVSMVDVGAVQQQELAGQQRPLQSKASGSTVDRYGSRSGSNGSFTPTAAAISAVLPSSPLRLLLTSAPWASAAAMVTRSPANAA